MNARKILAYALGPIGSAALGIVSLPLISWYFPAEDIGRIVLLQTVAALTILLLGLGLDQAYIREYYAAANKPSLFKSYVVLPVGMTAAAALLMGVFAPSWPSENVFSLDSATLGILFLVFVATTLITRFFALILRMQEQALAFSFSQLAPKLLILLWVAAWLLIDLPADTVGLVSAYTAAQVLTVALLVYLTRKELAAALRAPWSASLQQAGLRYGFPLACGNIAYWGFTSVDRFVLKQYSGLDELGIYSMAVSFGAAALIFQSVFSTIWAPMVFRWVEENKNLDKIGGITLDMSAAITAIICLVGLFSPLVPLILPDTYAPVQFILLSSMLFPLFYTLTEVSGIGLNVVKRTWLITGVNIAACLLNLALLFWLVPDWGARGAAMSIAVAFWAFFIIKTELSSRLWQALPRRKLYTRSTLCLLLCLSYTYWGSTSNYPLFALIWLLILGALFLQYRLPLRQTAAALKGRLKK